MAHWGWYWKVKVKHIPRKLCSNLTQIDSFKLYKNNTMAGFTVKPLDIKSEPNLDSIKITYRNHKAHSYTITIEKLPCNYGGFRCFFKCPLCSKRMRILYFAEQSVFLCRKCLNLSYQSQCLRPSMRYLYMSKKVENSIHNKSGDLYHKKPTNMHINKYQQLENKMAYYKGKSNQALNKELREWYGARVEPYLDSFFDYVPKKPI